MDGLTQNVPSLPAGDGLTERKRFDAWAARHMTMDGYPAYTAWDAWQAAILAAPRQPGEMGAGVRNAALEEAARLIETTRETTTIEAGGETQRHLTPRKGTVDLTGMTWAAGIRALMTAPTASAQQDERETCSYTKAIGDAGEAYMQRFAPCAHPLPAQFRWSELWDVMCAAPRQPGEMGAGVPEGFVVAPHYRGYARLGAGAYMLNHSKAGTPAELVISMATDEEKAGRVVGDERDNPDGYKVQPEAMAVRLRFENVAGLDALEQQLRHLRDVHFPASAQQDEREADAKALKDASEWLLDVMGDWDFTIPNGAFDKIVVYIAKGDHNG